MSRNILTHGCNKVNIAFIIIPKPHLVVAVGICCPLNCACSISHVIREVTSTKIIKNCNSLYRSIKLQIQSLYVKHFLRARLCEYSLLLSLCLRVILHAFFVICKLFFKFNLFETSFKSTSSVSNRLDLNQARLFVGPDLGPICLQRL